MKHLCKHMKKHARNTHKYPTIIKKQFLHYRSARNFMINSNLKTKKLIYIEKSWFLMEKKVIKMTITPPLQGVGALPGGLRPPGLPQGGGLSPILPKLFYQKIGFLYMNQLFGFQIRINHNISSWTVLQKLLFNVFFFYMF